MYSALISGYADVTFTTRGLYVPVKLGLKIWVCELLKPRFPN